MFKKVVINGLIGVVLAFCLSSCAGEIAAGMIKLAMDNPNATKGFISNMIPGVMKGQGWSEQSENRTVVVRRGLRRVNIRSGPSVRYRSFDSAQGGQIFQVTAKSGGWLKVRTPEGDGWIYASLVDRIIKPPPGAIGSANSPGNDTIFGGIFHQ